MFNKICLISVCFSVCICNIAAAEDAWVITPIQVNGEPTFSTQSCALAMRSDGIWPVISYTMGPEGRTAALTPAGWQAGLSVIPLGNNYRISGATSPGGSAAFAYGNGAVTMLGQNGWATSYYGSPMNSSNNSQSIAFQNNNPSVLYMAGPSGASGPGLTLATFNGFGWSQDKLENTQYQSFQSPTCALAFDSYNQANAAFLYGNQLMYGLKGALTQNQWSFSSLDRYSIHPDPFQIDMAMGAGDIPWIAYTQQNNLKYATYSVQQQGWVTGVIGQTIISPTMNFFSMASDGRGGIGIAYVGTDEMLSFAYNNGSGIWSYDTGITKIGYPRSVDLEFDAQNRAVICYANYSGQLSLAYDPVAVPEPASAAIIALGSALIASIRKRR